MKVREVAEDVDMSTERIHHIFHEYFDMKINFWHGFDS